MRCLQCGEINPPEMRNCRMCGEVIERRIEDALSDERRRATDSLTAPYKGPAALKPDTAKAVRFLITLLFLQGVPALLWFGSAWMSRNGLALPGTQIHTDTRSVQGFLVACFLIGNAYLVAKTGESLGARFVGNFFLACIPPLLPAVWARIGGKSVLKPYVYILADLAIVVAAALMVREQVLIAALAALLFVPVLFYQLYGCAVREVSTPLGLNSEVSIVWLCFGPLALTVVLLIDGAQGWIVEWYSQSLGDFIDSAHQFLSLDLLMQASTFQFLLAIYLLASWLVWVRAVYQGLKLPVM